MTINVDKLRLLLCQRGDVDHNTEEQIWQEPNSISAKKNQTLTVKHGHVRVMVVLQVFSGPPIND